MQKNTCREKLQRIRIKNKARLVNWTITTQAVEINGKIFRVPGRGNITIEKDDVVFFNKYALKTEETQC